MIFNCGETWAAKQARLSEWHPFFCIWPRTIREENGRTVCAWLQAIERKGTYCSSWHDAFWCWSYREAQQ